ncbi:MAG TPA: VacJ family lipoprotein [Syntrophorhabdaceae bacterium]|nr:VacJ family lipoprotein [Syntrophorhabdaceae bacterium]HQM82407.1 VacJ family lipoprotein [Syntrophorhabdaceae bacterium]
MSYTESRYFTGPMVCLALLFSLFLVFSQAQGVAMAQERTPDEYGDVTEEAVASAEGPSIADPIEPWNRAMYHFNDKLYFWLLKPVSQGYKYVIPESFRIIFSNFYENLMMPVRFVNNLLQGRPDYAGRELARFVINSTVGAAGFRDCAKDCFGIEGRKADLGQTLGKYGIGPGFYIVWPVLGPSSPRDTVGLVGDHFLKPPTYLSSDVLDPETIGINVHEKVNNLSFRIGDYEIMKEAAIDPYIAMRDAYVQYRRKLIEQNGPEPQKRD